MPFPSSSCIWSQLKGMADVSLGRFPLRPPPNNCWTTVVSQTIFGGWITCPYWLANLQILDCWPTKMNPIPICNRNWERELSFLCPIRSLLWEERNESGIEWVMIIEERKYICNVMVLVIIFCNRNESQALSLWNYRCLKSQVIDFHFFSFLLICILGIYIFRIVYYITNTK